MSSDNRAGRIIGGHGTHNRPWIVDEDDAAAATTANRTDRDTVAVAKAIYNRRLTAQFQQHTRIPIAPSQHQQNQQQLDDMSVSSGATQSSYERYLAQRRTEGGASATVASTSTTMHRQSHRGSLTNPHSQPSSLSGHRPVVAPQHPIRQRSASDYERRPTAPRPSNAGNANNRSSSGSHSVSSAVQSDNSTNPYQQYKQFVQKQQHLQSPSTGEVQQSNEKTNSTNSLNLVSVANGVDEIGKVSSRDLRAKRLAQQRQDSFGKSSTTRSPHSNLTNDKDGTTTSNTTPIRTEVPLHFQAHDAAVEKYLTRSRLTDPAGRSRTNQRTSNVDNHSRNAADKTTTRGTASEMSSLSSTHPPPIARGSSSSFIPDASIQQQPLPNPIQSSLRSQSEGVINTDGTTKGVMIDKPARGASESSVGLKPNRPTTTTAALPSGWSTLKRASTTGHSTMTSEAMAAHEAYKAETLAAAVSLPVQSSTGSSKVDVYLAQRQALKERASSVSRLGKKKKAPSLTVSAESQSTQSISTATNAPIFSNASSVDGSSESDVESDHDCEEKDESSSCAEDEKAWSVKVCIVSAVDFPASVVPNLPFSPLLKVGLIRVKTAYGKQKGDSSCTTSANENEYRELTSAIERDGIMSIPRSRVRCTNSKILSRRDNGSVEFHEEMRWDGVRQPERTVLALELSSRAVHTPANIRESPPQQFVGPLQFATSSNSMSGKAYRSSNQSTINDTGVSLSSLFRKLRKSDSAEMEEANAAAAVAKLLIQGDESNQVIQQDGKDMNVAGVNTPSDEHQNELKVSLRRRKTRKVVRMTDELRLGAKVIPLSQLALIDAMQKNETVRIEHWFELDTAMNTVVTSQVGTSPSSSTATRNPSILLEISFSAAAILDDSEDDLDQDGVTEAKASYSKRASLKIRNQLKQEVIPQIDKVEEPMLEPGIIDFVCVVGARDLGDQKADDGSSGWVNSTPECCIFEQFPSNDEFHLSNGRAAVLPGKVEWFCFPEGCKIWRGLTPPNHDELNLKRFSASSPVQVSTSIASFDACLGCTTSFSWFTISSNSDRYGSESKKTFGAVIRFYIPAPVGVDSTQDDFAQTGGASSLSVGPREKNERKRLWVPIGICVTSSMPIVGTMEVMLLRICESLSSLGILSVASSQEIKTVQEAIVSVVVSFQRPIPGIVNCSFPFLDGELLHIGLPSRTGLPALPHGHAVTAVCRLLGADGLNYLLAAFLTECKILLHSDEISNLSLVAEVLTSLLYPFSWSLPYVPVLPGEMMEFIEAPLSFLLGVPSCNVIHLDPTILEDIVVVDLDRDFSTTEFFESRRNGHKTKTPVPLPASMASNISKAVYRLIRAEEELEDSFGSSNFPGSRPFPRLEPESLPEREFRLSVALEVCGLIRGFAECLVFSSSQPVFNVDKFLQVAPAIFEEQRGQASTGHSPSSGFSRSVISPRSRRFVSILVCCQHFHQFLEVLDSESLSFFRVIMRSLQVSSAKKDLSLGSMLQSLDTQETVTDLFKTLQIIEDKTPTYRVKSYGSQWPTQLEGSEEMERTTKSTFPVDLLQQIFIDSDLKSTEVGSTGLKSVSLEYLVELEKNPWHYQKLFDLNERSPTGELSFLVAERVSIREAIGDRRYRAWKSGSSKFDADEASVISEESKGRPQTLDMSSLLSSIVDETPSISNEDTMHFRNVLRNCFESSKLPNAVIPRKLIVTAEVALSDSSAQRVMLEILNKRTENLVKRTGDNPSNSSRRRSVQHGGSKLEPSVFDLMNILAFSMLDSCDEKNDYKSAYSLLKLSAGLYAAIVVGENEVNVVYLTERIGLHPIYANPELWEMVYSQHVDARRHNLTEKDTSDVDQTSVGVNEYEAVVATLYEMNGYGIPAEELARFAFLLCISNDWYNSEKGQSLLMLAKRVSIRRDHGPISVVPREMSHIELINPSSRKRIDYSLSDAPKNMMCERESQWIEIGWCHPAAQSSRRAGGTETDASRRPNKNLLLQFEEKSTNGVNENAKYMRRSAITSLAYLGSSVTVTGGLDGGVFLARQVSATSDATIDDVAQNDVRGIYLDWGSSGSRYSVGSQATSLDGEYGVGAVTCLAATHSVLGASPDKPTTKDVLDPFEEEMILEAMEGCRLVAGTTCGDLRVWSIKDVYSAVFYANRANGGQSHHSEVNGLHESANNPMTTRVGRTHRGTDFAAGSSLTRLKFSLRGRALSGHRGGVSCIEIHSNVYRPDSIVSGGADGLIKLWSLKSPGSSGGRRLAVESKSTSSPISSSHNPASSSSQSARGGDALNILSGHGGRVLCVKTAWHGERLLSGGADRTVRMWDLAGSGGKCLSSLSGHFGWVTSVQYWGPNTIISASSDRSVALWDVRVRNSPLFMLRHHCAPVSDILIGPRSDSVMVSAAVDGSVAAWDFRSLSCSSTENVNLSCKMVRNPSGKLYIHKLNRARQSAGPVRLTRGFDGHTRTVACLGSDAVLREWDYQTGRILNERVTGHCDEISSFVAIGGDKVLDSQLESTGHTTASSFFSSSWDGTVRLHTPVR